ncbi:MAG: IPExxxVDY family protein [Bacteroidales bacterium]
MPKEKRLKYVPVTDFKLIAIASSEDAYRLSWVINQLFGIQLKRTDPLRVWDEKTENHREFVCYIYTSASQQSICRLISNKSESGFLDKTYSQFDYLFQFRHLHGVKSDEVVELLKNQKDILVAVEIIASNNDLTQKLMI